jgi:hypothetical protein
MGGDGGRHGNDFLVIMIVITQFLRADLKKRVTTVW